MLTVPQNVAQPLTDRLIELGIRGFWNFTNVELSSSAPDVFFENVHFVDTLLTLSYRHLPSLSAPFSPHDILWTETCEQVNLHRRSHYVQSGLLGR